ncbi:MAG TPA: hypothetical protein P5081_15920 [Phycisphaerae bacterium]|nr:hypothetical protein [Phycisphaerae bacterium]HRW54359.1 hypothetical protein [Phycisphaerae bacterium]
MIKSARYDTGQIVIRRLGAEAIAERRQFPGAEQFVLSFTSRKFHEGPASYAGAAAAVGSMLTAGIITSYPVVQPGTSDLVGIGVLGVNSGGLLDVRPGLSATAFFSRFFRFFDLAFAFLLFPFPFSDGYLAFRQ